MRFSWLENAYSRPLFSADDFEAKVRQTDLVFGVLSRFISGSVHAILQVSVCSGYDVCHHG